MTDNSVLSRRQRKRRHHCLLNKASVSSNNNILDHRYGDSNTISENIDQSRLTPILNFTNPERYFLDITEPSVSTNSNTQSNSFIPFIKVGKRNIITITSLIYYTFSHF